MPPTFRSSRSGRQFGEGAKRTGQIDHDVFEGLPVRRWTRQTQTVSQVPKTEASESIVQGPGGKQTIPEHPMPRDSHLLTPQSRALLRAARAGCIYIRQASKDSEDEEKEVTDVEEQPMLQSSERSFVTRKWATVPRHLEVSDMEFLAKRRPGLPSLYGASATNGDGANNSAPMRRTRFKKVDPATGNISIYEAWVPEGHKIEGEITDDTRVVPTNSEATVTPEAPAPGTVIDGVGVVNAEGVVVAEAGSVSVMTPPKRRPPPPKRKAKGFGKGRRKKVMFAPGDGAEASLVHGSTPGATDGTADDPSRMSTDHAGQEDEEDDGEEGEESDEGDESMLDAKTPETPGHQPSVEPATDAVSEPAPAPTEPIDASTDTKTSEMPSEMLSGTLGAPAPPSVPELAPPNTEAFVAATPDDPPKTAPTEDIEMTEAHPEVSLAEATTEPVDRSISDSAPITAGSDTAAPNQDGVQTSEPNPRPEDSKEGPVSGMPSEKPVEPNTTASAESALPTTSNEGTAMEISTDLPQISVDKPLEDASIIKQEDPKPTETRDEKEDVDMLETSETSLGQPVNATQVNVQAEEEVKPQIQKSPEETATMTITEQTVEKTAPDASKHESDEPAHPSTIQHTEQVTNNIEQESTSADDKVADATMDNDATELPSVRPTEPSPEEPLQKAAEQTTEPTVEHAEKAPESPQEMLEQSTPDQSTVQKSPITPDPPSEPSAEAASGVQVEQSGKTVPEKAQDTSTAHSPKPAAEQTEGESSAQTKEQVPEVNEPAPQAEETQPPQVTSPTAPTSLPEDSQPESTKPASPGDSPAVDVAPVAEPIPEQENNPSEAASGETEKPTEPPVPEPSNS